MRKNFRAGSESQGRPAESCATKQPPALHPAALDGQVAAALDREPPTDANELRFLRELSREQRLTLAEGRRLLQQVAWDEVGYFIALVPPIVFGYLTGGWGTVIAVIVVYAIINAIVQSVVQPRVVGKAVALSQTLTFFSVLFWAVVLGPIGAILAVPLTLLVRAVLVDSDPRARRWRPLIGDLAGAREQMRIESDARRAERQRAKGQRPG